MTSQLKDPVCGMSVNPSESNHKTEYQGKQYAFCSQQCLDKFKKTPHQYKAK